MTMRCMAGRIGGDDKEGEGEDSALRAVLRSKARLSPREKNCDDGDCVRLLVCRDDA